MHQELWLKAMHKTPDLTQEIINDTVHPNVHAVGKNFSNVQRIPNGYCVRYHTNIFVKCHVDIHTNAMFVINYIQQANVGMVVVIKIILIRDTLEGIIFVPFGDHHNPRVDLTNQGQVHFNLTHGSLGHQYGSQIVSQPSSDSQMRDISNKIDCKKLPTPVNISVLQFYMHNYKW